MLVTRVLALAFVLAILGSNALYTVFKVKTQNQSKSGRPTITFLKIGEYGRLGNQLFQVAATIGISETHGYNWGFYDNIDRSAVGRLFALRGQLQTERVAAYYEEQHGAYYDISLPKMLGNDVLSLEGYFQDFRYFENSLDTLNQYLQFPQDLLEHVKKRVPEVESEFSVAIHVRRADYLKLHTLYNVLDENYYVRALNLLVDHRIDNVIMISDDISWCKEHLSPLLPHKVVYSPFRDELEDFVLLYLARTVVIANSSFSWWAAFLKHIRLQNSSEQATVRVFAPTVWYNQSGAFSHLNRDDFFPRDWTKVAV